MTLKGKKIVLGVTGGIGAYKAAELIRLLIKAGAELHPVMTRAATEFITPLTLSTLAKNPALTTLFDDKDSEIPHIEIADKADLIIIAPATANTVGKIAGGIADDLLTTLVLAAKGPLLVAPAMNHRMWDNPFVKENIKKLLSFGCHIVGPAEGELACGYEGRGRLAPLTEIVEAAEKILSTKKLAGERLLVTAGPTREPIDPVRFLSNASSGKMGYAISRAALRFGAEVTLISGPTSIEPPAGLRFIPVTTASEMYDASIKEFEESTMVVMTAAVSDFSPFQTSSEKVKKSNAKKTLELEPTRDILKAMGERKGDRRLIGFALESSNFTEHATAKLNEKNLDMIVANPTHSMETDRTSGIIITADSETFPIEPMSKSEAAELILTHAVKLQTIKVPL